MTSRRLHCEQVLHRETISTGESCGPPAAFQTAGCIIVCKQLQVSLPIMDNALDSLMKTEFINVGVGDPRFHRDDFWHTHTDYEICLHTNSMCFRKKASCVRRRYSEFVWLRHCLQQNALIIELPKLPPWNPFFSMTNKEQVTQRMKGLQEFLEIVLETPLLLSDSHLHLFLQSELSVPRIERCARGETRYSVAEAIQRSSGCLISSSFPLDYTGKGYSDSDCESSASSGLGLSGDVHSRCIGLPCLESSSGDHELFCTLSRSPSEEKSMPS
ncbi:sorting nexin-10A isoform X1 [Gadus chalcogrammus]|uniref:sorting nexin-10A isoform X1 n=1 Tax=Gadus chalcogrammus TaxID=1042646 RepID=UPI0024C4DE53|nr:sorting nexin-10A isoform X1 [Gadus chalcogrammus]